MIFSNSSNADDKSQKTITLASDPYCPYTCEVGSDRPGFMVEFAIEALRPLGYEIIYQTMPWKRALKRAHEGELDGLFTVERDESINLVVSDTPVAYTCMAIVTRKNFDFVWDGPNSLNSKKTALISGYIYESLQSWHKNPDNSKNIIQVSGENALEQILKMIVRGRVDTSVADCNVGSLLAHNIGLDDKTQFHITNLRAEMFIGIHKDRPDAKVITDAIDKALQEMSADGRLKALREKYSLRHQSMTPDQ